MEKLLTQVLVTFTLGFLVIGVVIGVMPVGSCGSAFSPAARCGSGAVATQLALVIAFLGLGLTGLVAAIRIDITTSKPAPQDGPEDDPEAPDA